MGKTNWSSDDAWLGLFFVIMLWWFFPLGLLVMIPLKGVRREVEQE